MMDASRLHVLILPSWYFPHGSQAIAGRMFHQHALALRHAGVDARIMYIQRTPRQPLLKKISYEAEMDVPTIRAAQWFPPKTTSWLMSWWARTCARDVMRYIRTHGKPDVIHAQSYMAATIANAVKQKTGIPYVYTERLSSVMLKETPRHHVPVIRQAMSNADAITAVSPGMMHVLEAQCQKPVQVIPNFFDDRLFYHEPNVEKNAAFTFVSVGEPAHVKGLDVLLHAYANLKETFRTQEMELVLVDDIPEKASLQQLATSLHIDQDIIWTGLIPQDQLADILRKSHMLVSASRVETFGKAILEAQACGLPVVATRTDGARYILSSSSQGELCEINDVQGLMKAMAGVMTGYDRYAPGALHQMMEKRFGKKKVTTQWIHLYQSIRV